jgi:hypothetical protein
MKMVVITVPFVISLFKSLYYLEIAMEHDLDSLINKFWIAWPRYLLVVEARTVKVELEQTFG